MAKYLGEYTKMKKGTVTRRILLLIVAHFTGGLTLQPRARLPVSSTSTRGSTAASLTRMMGSRSTAAPRRVAIIGAGPAGLTLANALLQQGAEAYDEVAVFDRFGELKPGTGGGLQINGGAAVLAELGFQDALRGSALPMKRVVSRRAGGMKLLDLDVHGAMREGAPEWLVKGLVEGEGGGSGGSGGSGAAAAAGRT